MPRKAKKTGSGVTPLIVAIVLAIIFAPKGGWTVFLLLMLVVIAIGALARNSKNADKSVTHAAVARSAPHANPSVARASHAVAAMGSHEDEFVSFTLPGDSRGSSYQISSPGLVSADGVRWVGPAETVQIGALQVQGGLFYLGPTRKAEATDIDACVINPKMQFAADATDVSAGPAEYWLTYKNFSVEQRGAYLHWLASGRAERTAAQSFVTFYSYGLERRLLVDAAQNIVSKDEIQIIIAELERLRETYPDHRGALNLDGLLDFATVLLAHPQRLYETTPTQVRHAFEVPLGVRVAFGQAAVDKRPVPIQWALAWIYSDFAVNKRTPVHRCTTEFERLFASKYTQRFREGLTFPANKTKLRVAVRPAFPALRDVAYPDFVQTLPDINAVTGPRNKLQEVVNECSDALDAYSRYLGRNPETEGTLESALLLPVELWPEELSAELDKLKSETAAGIVVTTFAALFERFKALGTVSKDKLSAFNAALGDSGIAVEPDIRLTSKTPKIGDTVALFPTPPSVTVSAVDESYLTVALMVDISASVAMADGIASPREVALIHEHIESWPLLTARQHNRLKARAAVQFAQPATLASLKKRLEPVSTDAKHALATLLVRTANADGVVSPGEVKMLEKVYQMLGFDSQQLYSDLHGGAVRTPSASAPLMPKAPGATSVGETGSFTLDTNRIQSLKRETENVSALLAGIFVEEIAQPATESVSNTAEAELEGLLGLDPVHSTFLRLLISRREWTRAELADAAVDLDLMLDGAIERVNEVVIDHWDEPLTDGEDPVEINQELAQRLVA